MTFRRPRRGEGRALLGVCAGLARRWELEPRTVRLALLVTLIPFGAGLLVYAALALMMPADGASDAEAGWRGEIGRSIVEALLALGALLGLLALAAVATGLAVFGLAAVALLLATAALGGVIAIDHPRSWVFGGLAIVLAAPAAIVELTDVSVARQFGDERIAITRPLDVRPAGYRAGLGSMLIDLRDFDAEERTTTTIRARSDLRGFVVALPTDRCFNLEVDYSLDRSWLLHVASAAQKKTVVVPSALGYDQRFVRPADGRGPARPVAGALVAFGRSYPGDAGRYRRPVRDPGAPTIRLELGSGRSQIHVRDYPLSVDPLGEQEWPQTTMPPPSLDQLEEELRPFGAFDVSTTPSGTPSRAKPSSTLRSEQTRGRDAKGFFSRGVQIQIDPKTGQIVAKGRTAAGAVNQALQALVQREAYPGLQARKLAGACASRAVVSRIRKRLQREQDAETRAFMGKRGSQVGSLLEYQATLRKLMTNASTASRALAASSEAGQPAPSGLTGTEQATPSALRAAPTTPEKR
ncbi:MAG: PspC domain-containing protein [Solirubrobacteraceae bacterium]|nr:PspC domain-containing protein [Solirubrobacteraceae bacterium]